jgi:hypothetical protein
MVRRLDDVAIEVDGRVISVTVIPINGSGGKITIPFEKLKVVRGQDGAPLQVLERKQQ